MLGRYRNFPTNIEGFARFTYAASTRTLQHVIVQALHRLNKETVDMKTITKASPPDCTVNFEFGVADADTFNFLDQEELHKIEVAIKQQPLVVLDVYCVARYHTTKTNGKRKSLKFDYSMLRFAFHRENMQLFVYHERGTQRIPLEDLALFLQEQINKQSAEKHQEKLVLKNVIKSQLMFGSQYLENNT